MRLKLIIALLLSLLLAACGGDSGPTTLTGTVTKGPVGNATINIFAMNADGSQGALVAGPITTDADGNWTADLTGAGNGPFLVVSSGGTFVDEATGNTVNAPTMRSIMPNSSFASVPVTPLTEAMVTRVQLEAPAGITTLDDVITQIVTGFTTAFGFDPMGVIPTPPLAPANGASTAQLQYAIFLGALSHMLDNNGALAAVNGQALADILLAIAQDLADLQLDGLLNGNPIPVGAFNLPALSQGGPDALNGFINAFLLAQTGFPQVAAPNASFQQITIVNNGGGAGGGASGGCDAACQTFFARINGVNFGVYALTHDVNVSSGSVLPPEFDGAATYNLTVSSSGGLFLDSDSGANNFQFTADEITNFNAPANETNVFYTDAQTGFLVLLQEDTATGDLFINISDQQFGGENATLESNPGAANGGGSGGGSTAPANPGGGSGPAGTATLTNSGTGLVGTEFTPIALGIQQSLNLPFVGTTNVVSFTQTDAITNVLGGTLVTLNVALNQVSPQVQLVFLESAGATPVAWIANEGGGISGTVTVGANTVTLTNVVLIDPVGGSSLRISGTLTFIPAP